MHTKCRSALYHHDEILYLAGINCTYSKANFQTFKDILVWRFTNYMIHSCLCFQLRTQNILIRKYGTHLLCFNRLELFIHNHELRGLMKLLHALMHLFTPAPHFIMHVMKYIPSSFYCNAVRWFQARFWHFKYHLSQFQFWLTLVLIIYHHSFSKVGYRTTCLPSDRKVVSFTIHLQLA